MLNGTHLLTQGDVIERLRELPAGSVQCVVTSPPYWGLRDYGEAGQIGLEKTPEEYVEKMASVFREVRRVLRDDGTAWVNMGDSYANISSGGGGAVDIRTDGRRTTPGDKVRGRQQGTNTMAPGLKPKDLCGMPWRLAFALQADGWYLRSDIIWSKPNPMPESCTDRPTKAHEYLFLLTKRAKYYYDADAVREAAVYEGDARHLRFDAAACCPGARPDNGSRGRTGNPTSGRNLRTVWHIPTQAYPDAHFATFPEKLVEPCVKAGSMEGSTVLDPFCGSGTVGVVACQLGRDFIGIDLSAEYLAMAERRIGKALKPSTYVDRTADVDAPLFVSV
jgi:DNA modification methylase